jgi:hypothetical protein
MRKYLHDIRILNYAARFHPGHLRKYFLKTFRGVSITGRGNIIVWDPKLVAPTKSLLEEIIDGKPSELTGMEPRLPLLCALFYIKNHTLFGAEKWAYKMFWKKASTIKKDLILH